MKLRNISKGLLIIVLTLVTLIPPTLLAESVELSEETGIGIEDFVIDDDYLYIEGYEDALIDEDDIIANDDDYLDDDYLDDDSESEEPFNEEFSITPMSVSSSAELQELIDDAIAEINNTNAPVSIDIVFAGIFDSVVTINNTSGQPLTINFTGTMARSAGGTGAVNVRHFNITGGEVIFDGNYTLTRANGNTGNLGGVRVTGSGTIFTMNNGIIHDNEADSGGGVSVLNDGQFILNNGEIKDNEANWGGGVILDFGSNFTMNGGFINDNESSAHGGGVYIHRGSTFEMVRGNISNNSSDNNGGGVQIADDSSNMTMTGGIISENTAESSGGGIFVQDGARIEMTGGIISENTAESSGGGIRVFEGSLTMTDGIVFKNRATWGAGVQVDDDGSFVMKDNAMISDNVATNNGGGVNAIGGSFDIEGGTITGNSAVNGGGILVGVGTQVTMSNGTISYNRATNGAGIQVVQGSTFNLRNGNIVNNIAANPAGASGNGGGINVLGRFEMSDGRIAGNTAQWGGGVHVQGIFEMRGGTISENVVASTGGGVFLHATGTFNMNGGAIEENRAANGAGIQAQGQLALRNNSRINKNIATGSGGGVFLHATGTFNMNGGAIEENRAANGAGIQAAGELTLQNNNSRINNNIATGNGGGVNVYGGSFTLNNGTVNGNTARNGGGVYVTSLGTLTMYDGDVTGNTAAIDGGGVFTELLAVGTEIIQGEHYSNLQIYAAVNFTGNSASQAHKPPYNLDDILYRLEERPVTSLIDPEDNTSYFHILNNYDVSFPLAGALSFEVPDRLEFGTWENRIQHRILPLQNASEYLIVRDYREINSQTGWTLTATLSENFTNNGSNELLNGADLIYQIPVSGGGMQRREFVLGQAVLIYEQPSGRYRRYRNFSSEHDWGTSGFALDIFEPTEIRVGEYTGVITWNLVQGPPD